MHLLWKWVTSILAIQIALVVLAYLDMKAAPVAFGIAFALTLILFMGSKENSLDSLIGTTVSIISLLLIAPLLAKQPTLPVIVVFVCFALVLGISMLVTVIRNIAYAPKVYQDNEI